ncbi:MAG: SDR family oxidoreductase [Polyangiales bacterium]
MNVFVTGATGFIGRYLLERLLARPELQVFVLVRRASVGRFLATLSRYGADASRIHVLAGDLSLPGLVEPSERPRLPARFEHVFHLAAIYDMGMSDEEADRINLDGTREVVAFANSLGPTVRFHHVSSVAVSGDLFEGCFLESHFDEGQRLEHPYYRSKLESERIVRERCRVPYRIYRPGIVVGHSETGEIAKTDGPYYFFDKVRLASAWLPRFLPLVIVEGGRMPLVPVDYVARAIDAIAFQDGLDEQVFCLLAPDPPSVGELVALLFHAAGGPRVFRLRFPLAARLAHGLFARMRRFVPRWLAALGSRLIAAPTSVLGQLFSQATYDDRNTRLALAGTDVVCPRFQDLVGTLWAGWERHETRAALPSGASTPSLAISREPAPAPSPGTATRSAPRAR